MIITGALIPHGETILAQQRSVKRNALVLLGTIILNSGYQTVVYSFDIGRVFLEFLGIVFCVYILNIERVTDCENKAEERDQQTRTVLLRIERLSNVLIVVLTGITAGYQQLPPLIIFTLTVLEHISKKLFKDQRYSFAVKWMNIFYILAQVLPVSLYETSFLGQTGFIVAILLTVLTISKIKLRKNKIVADKEYTQAFGNPERLWKLLNDYPNFVFLIDRFWPFLLPIPLVIGIWSLSFFNSQISPKVLGLVAVFTSCMIFVHIHWLVARIIAIRISQLIEASLIFTVLIFEKCSQDRLLKVFILFSMITYSWYIDSIYRIVHEKNRTSEKPLKPMKSFLTPVKGRIYFDMLQRLWTLVSPIVSAFLISLLTVKTLHTKMRLGLLALTAWTGIFARVNVPELWVLIEIYVIMEQNYLLFLSQENLPVPPSEIQGLTLWTNLLILFIAECQRLSSMPSIFKIQAHCKSAVIQHHSERENESEEIVKEQVEEELKDKVDNSWLWSKLVTLGRVTSVLSLLALMAVLLFYPQIIREVTVQTCAYSLWAGLFTFLFYRPAVTARLRLIFIGILAILSGSFFVYNLFLANVKIPKDEASWNIFALHGSVFWLSCAALFTMERTEYAKKSETEESSRTPQVRSESISDSVIVFKTPEDTPRMVASKLATEAGSILERLFVLQWTRSCALLAFMAASFNPSLFGVIHLIIGCGLAWKNILSPRLYVPMILWLLCATFLPAIFYKFVPQEHAILLKILVGELVTIKSTICLTVWALILFLQPVFVNSLLKLTTEKERADGLVSFQILPQEESSTLSQSNYESFENSTRYYLSNWFLEFHNEIMIAVLVVAIVSRKNFYGIIYAFLTMLHVLVPLFGRKQRIGMVARISFNVQLFCFIAEYCLAIVYKNAPKKLYNQEKLFYVMRFLGLSSETQNYFFAKSVLVGLYVILTVRWYLTSVYYQKMEDSTTRFDTHWCRLCNQVNFKSMHAYSRVKHNCHLYLGWVAHCFLFMTAVSAYTKPTIPSVILLILSLIYFFYGEATVLMPKLRNKIFLILTIILLWATFDAMTSLLGVIEGGVKNTKFIEIMCYLGLTNIVRYSSVVTVGRGLIFEGSGSRAILGITVFLILLQTRLYRSKAWPFVLARLYHSYATSAKRAKIFRQNLQAAIIFQKKNLEKASEQVKKQIESMKSLDISDWKKLCYAPPLKESEEEEGRTSEMPIYGTEAVGETAVHEDTQDNEDSNNNTNLRQRNIGEIHRPDSEERENDHLEQMNMDNNLTMAYSTNEMNDLNLNHVATSDETLVPSDEAARKEMKEMELNFYWYTWISLLRSIVKYVLQLSQDYRRLQNRPSRKSSLRIIFHHRNMIYRVQFLIQLFFDLINANFDLVLDCLVLDAQVAHSSGFSLLMVLGVLLIGRMQRPYTSKFLHSRLLILCATWITFNFCKVVFLKDAMYQLDKSEMIKRSAMFVNVASMKLKESKILSNGVISLYQQIIGIHIGGTIEDVTYRPTLILLALSYKRSLMRHLGLWDYGKGIEMARIYYRSEEDLDEIGELNVSDSEDKAADSDEDDLTDDEFSSASSVPESEPEVSIASDTSSSPYVNGWKNLLWPSVEMPWRDYYVPMFLSDFICLFLMMYYWGEFTLGSHTQTSKNVSFFEEMVNQNMIPAPLVNMIIISTFVLVIDRALYVSKNYLGKFILQVITIIGYHAYIFFHLPKFHLDKNVSDVVGLKIWYFFKWIYWITSALQLKYNYPPLRIETFLGTEYGIVSGNLHVMYRSFPFLEELKTTIDWSVSPSALGLWPWLKFSDIFERLYAVQCARAFQGTYYGRHEFGVPFNQFTKLMQGAVFITLSVLILWSPFLILSRSSMMTPNTIKSFKLEIGIENHGPAFVLLGQNELEMLTSATDKYQNVLRTADGVNPFEVDPTYFTRIQLPEVSQSQWTVSEEARKSTLKFLEKPDKPVKLQFNWTITRERSQAIPISQGSVSRELNQQQIKQLKTVLSADLSPETPKFATFDFSGIFPSLLKAPLTEVSTQLTTFHDQIQVKLIRACPNDAMEDFDDLRSHLKSMKTGKKSNGSEKAKRAFLNLKKKLKEVKSFGSFIKDHRLPENECQFYLRFYNAEKKVWEPVNMYVYSTKLPKYNFSSFNLIGLYATVVLTIAQILKMMHADMTTRIQYDDLPNPLPLLVMCQQMLMMRELGDFESEEAIYWQIIEILRNPQTLIEMTKM